MMKTIRKLSIRLIVLQCFFLYFFSSASERLYAAFNSGVFDCIFKKSSKELGFQCMENYPEYRIADLMTGPIHFMMYGFLVGVVIVIFLNWRKKKYFLNTILAIGLNLLLYFSHFFQFLKLDKILLAIGYAFSDTFSIVNLIIMQIALIISLVLLWLSVRRIQKQSLIKDDY